MLTVAAALACSGDPTVGSIVVSVTVTPDRDTVAVGETSTRLSAVAKNANGDPVTDAKIVWKSDQPFLAAVDSLTGAVHGLAAGGAAITASVGPLSDTAQVFVVPPVVVFLPVDTLLLAVGDTMTIPATVNTRAGTTTPHMHYSGGSAAVATVDTASGLVTAVASGIVPFTVFADSFSAPGAVAVLILADTTVGFTYMGITGGIPARQFQTNARAFNQPTGDGRTSFEMNSLSAGSQDQFLVLLIGSVTQTGTFPIGTLPQTTVRNPNAPDPVCLPPDNWAFYADLRPSSQIDAPSVSGGSFSITSVDTLPGGKVMSGRFSVTLERHDKIGQPDGLATAIGTFVIPVLQLSKCGGP